MTTWDNKSAGPNTPQKVKNWLRNNIADIDGNTQIRVTMRKNNPAKIGWLYVRKTLDSTAITDIETQFPELVGTIT